MLWPFDIPNGGFRVICADPPWVYSVFSEKGKGRSAERHYACMSLDEIAKLPVETLAAKDCHLFMWVTGPCLAAGMHIPIMESWGFKPSTDAFVWLKVKSGFTGTLCAMDERAFTKGMGHTTRKNAEYVILGRRGSPKRQVKDMHQIIISDRREHSRKPDEFFARVERYAAGPYLELFSRESRPGWVTWGNEANKFDGEGK